MSPPRGGRDSPQALAIPSNPPSPSVDGGQKQRRPQSPKSKSPRNEPVVIVAQPSSHHRSALPSNDFEFSTTTAAVPSSRSALPMVPTAAAPIAQQKKTNPLKYANIGLANANLLTMEVCMYLRHQEWCVHEYLKFML